MVVIVSAAIVVVNVVVTSVIFCYRPHCWSRHCRRCCRTRHEPFTLDLQHHHPRRPQCDHARLCCRSTLLKCPMAFAAACNLPRSTWPLVNGASSGRVGLLAQAFSNCYVGEMANKSRLRQRLPSFWNERQGKCGVEKLRLRHN